MRRQYIALIHKEDASDYGVSFPDLPGCVTAGATLDEARAPVLKRLWHFISRGWPKMARPSLNPHP